uniref:Uncharacterized protein n=1 Tax=Vitis vinifera TaxID=29760 RepID=F6H685_VITVI
MARSTVKSGWDSIKLLSSESGTTLEKCDDSIK